MECPKCHAAMYPVQVEGYEVQRCSSCEGLWFTLREAEHLRDVHGAAKALDCAPTEKGRQFNAIRDYPCPACHGPMVKITVPEQPQIQIEQCSVCNGTFFDAGEFTDYQHFTLPERIRLFFSAFHR